MVSSCCGAKVIGECGNYICAKCKEHCEGEGEGRKYRGTIEVFYDVEADNEMEAIKKLAERLSKELLSGETEFCVWEDSFA